MSYSYTLIRPIQTAEHLLSAVSVCLIKVVPTSRSHTLPLPKASTSVEPMAPTVVSLGAPWARNTARTCQQPPNRDMPACMQAKGPCGRPHVLMLAGFLAQEVSVPSALLLPPTVPSVAPAPEPVVPLAVTMLHAPAPLPASISAFTPALAPLVIVSASAPAPAVAPGTQPT